MSEEISELELALDEADAERNDPTKWITLRRAYGCRGAKEWLLPFPPLRRCPASDGCGSE